MGRREKTLSSRVVLLLVFELNDNPTSLREGTGAVLSGFVREFHLSYEHINHGMDVANFDVTVDAMC